jgi:hypothetical protein
MNKPGVFLGYSGGDGEIGKFPSGDYEEEEGDLEVENVQGEHRRGLLLVSDFSVLYLSCRGRIFKYFKGKLSYFVL